MVSIVQKFVELDLLERERHTTERESNVIWVSDLVQCKQKAQFYSQFPQIYQLEPRLWLGKIVHRGFQEFLKETYNAEVEKEFEKSIGVLRIRGRVDAIVSDTVVEIKYASDVYNNEPNEHHVRQLQLYMWLTDLEKGKLIYISPKKLLEFDEQGKPDDDFVLLLYDSWKSPRYEWECSYCPFSAICPYKVERR